MLRGELYAQDSETEDLETNVLYRLLMNPQQAVEAGVFKADTTDITADIDAEAQQLLNALQPGSRGQELNSQRQQRNNLSQLCSQLRRASTADRHQHRCRPA